jgi:nifR3 family TIM-barrel protein
MAPMVGLTTRAFRLVALREGCALAAAEMVAAEHLVRADRSTLALRALEPDEHPTACQIVGEDPGKMAEGARIVEDLGADVLDVNMGCPVRRIVRTGAGSALVGDPSRAGRIVGAVRRAVSVPVTVKIRAADPRATTALLKAVEEAGADAVTVHARRPSARHRGPPDHEALARAVGAVRIPVVGNGGIRCPEDAREMVRRTACRGVMVGRAAIGDASLFDRIARLLHRGEKTAPPTGRQRLEILSEHLRLLVRERGSAEGVVLFRKCLPHYLRERRGARGARARLGSLRTPEDVLRAAAAVLQSSEPASGEGAENPLDSR